MILEEEEMLLIILLLLDIPTKQEGELT